MGTNYYAQINKCAHCGRSDELHIGKSSAGWCFALRVYPEQGINDLDDWEPLLRAHAVRNEYGDVFPAPALSVLDTIRHRSWDGKERPLTWWTENHAEPGPNGLARHRSGERGVRHGAGTWDCIEYEFR